MPGFRRVSEDELLKTWLFRVDRFHLMDPDGEPFERSSIRHPGAVAIIAVHQDGTVSLVRQYRAAVDALVLEIAGWSTRDEGDESPRGDGTTRAGGGGRSGGRSLEMLIGTWNTPGVSDQHTTIFLATELSACADRARRRRREAHDG